MFVMSFVSERFFLSCLNKPQKEKGVWIYIVFFLSLFISRACYYLVLYFLISAPSNIPFISDISLIIMMSSIFDNYSNIILIAHIFLPIVFIYLFRSAKYTPFLAIVPSISTYILFDLSLNYDLLFFRNFASWIAFGVIVTLVYTLFFVFRNKIKVNNLQNSDFSQSQENIWLIIYANCKKNSKKVLRLF